MFIRTKKILTFHAKIKWFNPRRDSTQLQGMFVIFVIINVGNMKIASSKRVGCSQRRIVSRNQGGCIKICWVFGRIKKKHFLSIEWNEESFTMERFVIIVHMELVSYKKRIFCYLIKNEERETIATTTTTAAAVAAAEKWCA